MKQQADLVPVKGIMFNEVRGFNPILDPRIENSGPDEFSLRKIKAFPFSTQRELSKVVGTEVFDYFHEKDLWEDFMSVQHAIAIQREGVVAFDSISKADGNNLFFARSPRMDKGTCSIYLPFLHKENGTVLLSWRCMFKKVSVSDLFLVLW